VARWTHASIPFALSAYAHGSRNPALAHLARRRRRLLCAMLPTPTLQQKWCRLLPSTIGNEDIWRRLRRCRRMPIGAKLALCADATTTIQMATCSATRAAAPITSRACRSQSKLPHVVLLTGQTQVRRRLTGSVQSVLLFMEHRSVRHRVPRPRTRRHHAPRPRAPRHLLLP